MHTSKCDYYEISVKVIRMPEIFLWGEKGAKHMGFSMRTALGLHDVRWLSLTCVDMWGSDSEQSFHLKNQCLV